MEITMVKNGKTNTPDVAAYIPTGRIIARPGKTGAVCRAELTGIAESIRKNGITAPLTVRPSSKSGVYELVEGEERLRAAKMLGLSAVPCVLVGGEPASATERAGDKEPGAPALPEAGDMFEQAQALRSIAEIYGLTQEGLAERFSVSQPYIANKLRLLRFTPEERKMITGYSLSERHARALLGVPDPEKRAQAVRTAGENRLTVAQTEEYVARLNGDGGDGQALTRGKKEKVVLGDLRGFYNSVDNAVAVLIKAGLTVVEERSVTEDSVSVTVTVKRGIRA